MSMLMRIVLIMLAFAAVAPAQVPPKTPEDAPPTPPAKQVPDESPLEDRTWAIENQERTALLHVPSEAAQSEKPVVLAFHGHGGNARQASRSFRIHEVWPEAIVVYLQGLPTPGALTDPEGKKNGWQSREGLQGDRDLKFVDAVLATLRKEFKIDERRIYAMGHSNGGAFTYLLWRVRPDTFTAFAPSGAFTGQARNLKPKPAIHIAGRNDELVKFEYQQRTIETVRKINGCAEEGEQWAKDCTLYPSKTGTPFVTFAYDGTHKYPTEASALIVKFFKEQAKPMPKEPERNPPQGGP